jgi:hypothetical protein
MRRGSVQRRGEKRSNALHSSLSAARENHGQTLSDPSPTHRPCSHSPKASFHRPPRSRHWSMTIHSLSLSAPATAPAIIARTKTSRSGEFNFMDGRCRDSPAHPAALFEESWWRTKLPVPTHICAIGGTDHKIDHLPSPPTFPPEGVYPVIKMPSLNQLFVG